MEYNLIVFVILVGFSAFFSAVEIAFFSLTPGKVRAMVRKKLPYARRVERLKRNPQRLLVTVLVGNNIVNILASLSWIGVLIWICIGVLWVVPLAAGIFEIIEILGKERTIQRINDVIAGK